MENRYRFEIFLYTITAIRIVECNLRLTQMNILYHVKLKLTYNMLT